LKAVRLGPSFGDASILAVSTRALTAIVRTRDGSRRYRAARACIVNSRANAIHAWAWEERADHHSGLPIFGCFVDNPERICAAFSIASSQVIPAGADVSAELVTLPPFPSLVVDHVAEGIDDPSPGAPSSCESDASPSIGSGGVSVGVVSSGDWSSASGPASSGKPGSAMTSSVVGVS
jgi:hypothetical protein